MRLKNEGAPGEVRNEQVTEAVQLAMQIASPKIKLERTVHFFSIPEYNKDGVLKRIFRVARYDDGQDISWCQRSEDRDPISAEIRVKLIGLGIQASRQLEDAFQKMHQEFTGDNNNRNLVCMPGGDG